MSAEQITTNCNTYTALKYGPGGFDYGAALELPDNLREEGIFATPTWQFAEEALAGSFVGSGGRQGVQLGELLGLAMLHDEEYRNGEGPGLDRMVLESDLIVEAVRSWGLPGRHTKAPNNKEGLVAGVYNFWLLSLRDAVNLVEDPKFVLPSGDMLEDRFDACGVEMLTASSNTAEEMAVIKESYQKVAQDDLAVVGGLDRFIQGHSLMALANGAKHWSVNRRPRTGVDKHQLLWRTCIEYAVDRPEDDRTLYDRLVLRQADVLAATLEMEPDELAFRGLTRFVKRHGETMALYNETHPDRPLESIIDGIDVPRRILAGGSR